MGKFKIDPGDEKGNFRITQNVGDLKACYERGEDYSRISAFRREEGLHTGSNSDTIGRDNQPFGQNKNN